VIISRWNDVDGGAQLPDSRGFPYGTAVDWGDVPGSCCAALGLARVSQFLLLKPLLMGPGMEVGRVLETLGYLSVLGNFVWGPQTLWQRCLCFWPSLVFEFRKRKPFPVEGKVDL